MIERYASGGPWEETVGYSRVVAAGPLGRAHAEVFAAVRPAATLVVVAKLLDPAMLVEVEVVALRGERR